MVQFSHSAVPRKVVGEGSQEVGERKEQGLQGRWTLRFVTGRELALRERTGTNTKPSTKLQA